MSGSVNKVFLIGNLGMDPEVKFMEGGQPLCKFRIATSESWNDKQGQKQERTDWHGIVAWGKLAEICGKYLSKGSKVCVEGSLQTQSWEKDGQKHFKTEVKAREVTFLGTKRADSGSDNAPANSSPPSDDDCPPF